MGVLVLRAILDKETPLRWRNMATPTRGRLKCGAADKVVTQQGAPAETAMDNEGSLSYSKGGGGETSFPLFSW